MPQAFDPTRDYYKDLDLQSTASVEEVKASYRKLARKWHPDLNKEKGAEAKFKIINEASSILSNEKVKKEYDEARSHFSRIPFTHVAGSSRHAESEFTADYQDLFNSFFTNASRFHPEGHVAQTIEGEDIEITIAISLEDAVRGCNKEIEAKSGKLTVCSPCEGRGAQKDSSTVLCSQCGGSGRKINFGLHINRSVRSNKCSNCKGEGRIPVNPCKECTGTGRVYHSRKVIVNIPAGVSDGDKLRVAGQGSPGVNSAPGDLYITIRVNDHDSYFRKGMDLHCTHRVPLVVALKGGKCSMRHIDGNDLTFTVPSNMEAGSTMMRIKGKGMCHPMTRVTGDLYVHLEVALPRNQSPKVMELLDQLEIAIKDDST